MSMSNVTVMLLISYWYMHDGLPESKMTEVESTVFNAIKCNLV